MKKILDLKGFAALAAAVAIVAVTAVSFTSADSTDTSNVSGLRGRFGFNSSNEQGTQMRQHLTLTDEQKAEMESKREEMQAQMEARQAKMKTIMESGDYSAWVTFMSEDDRSSKAVEEVTEAEFPRLVEAWKLMQEAKENMDEARAIHEEIGLTGMGLGMGMGAGEGFSAGHGKGMGRGGFTPRGMKQKTSTES